MADLWLMLLEKVLGGGPMSLDALDVRLDARDLGFQRVDPLLELVDRDRIEVLAPERDQRVVGLARKEVFEVHA